MPKLLTVEQFREIFPKIDEDFADDSLKRPIGIALRRIKAWVGDEAFSDAEKENPSNVERKEDLELGVAYLAMHFLITPFNTAVRPGGIVKTEKVDDGDAVIQYLVPSETKARTQEYFNLAVEACKPYLLESNAATVEVADVE